MENFLDETATQKLYEQKRYAELNASAIALSEQHEGELACYGKWRRLHIKDAIFDENDEIFSCRHATEAFHDFNQLNDFEEEHKGNWGKLKDPDIRDALVSSLPSAADYARAQQNLKYQSQALRNLEQHSKALKAGKTIVLEIKRPNQKTKFMYFNREKQLTDYFLKTLGVSVNVKKQGREQ